MAILLMMLRPLNITITGFPAASVYDLAYDNARKLLYACGNGFVGSFDISSYCAANTYTVNVATSCATLTAAATISPVPPAGSVLTYELYDGVTLKKSPAMPQESLQTFLPEPLS